jgi:hypothetical protein
MSRLRYNSCASKVAAEASAVETTDMDLDVEAWVQEVVASSYHKVVAAKVVEMVTRVAVLVIMAMLEVKNQRVAIRVADLVEVRCPTSSCESGRQ